jgi:hypothetical protein
MDRVNVKIVTLQVSDWREYKHLRLEALKKEPSAFPQPTKKNQFGMVKNGSNISRLLGFTRVGCFSQNSTRDLSV